MKVSVYETPPVFHTKNELRKKCFMVSLLSKEVLEMSLMKWVICELNQWIGQNDPSDELKT